MRVLVRSCVLFAAVVSGCATSEDVPSVFQDVDSASAQGGSAGAAGAPAGGSGIGGAGGTPSTGGAWFNGAGGSAGTPSITCGMTQCPDCVASAFFGTQCCKADGKCGCKAFFGIGNCM